MALRREKNCWNFLPLHMIRVLPTVLSFPKKVFWGQQYQQFQIPGVFFLFFFRSSLQGHSAALVRPEQLPLGCAVQHGRSATCLPFGAGGNRSVGHFNESTWPPPGKGCGRMEHGSTYGSQWFVEDAPISR